MTSSPFFDNICTLPLPTDVFAAVVHPSKPIITVGLASGHVIAYGLPPVDTEETAEQDTQPRRESFNCTNSILSQRRRSSSASENGLGSIETIWKTRRHKGSCRALAYNHAGSICFSAGTDGLVKAFRSESGKVVSKVALPAVNSIEIDAPTLLHVLTPLHLIVATDSGALYIYDLDDKGEFVSSQPTKTYHPHGDEHVSSLVPIPPTAESTSGFPKQFITVGGSTLAVIDIRKGVLATSEDLETEVSSVDLITGLKSGGTSVGSKALVGQSDGVISLFERGVWDDLDERIVVDREGASIDAICEVPFDFLPKGGKLKMNEKVAAVGLDDGTIRFVRIGRNAVIYEWDLKHDDLEGVLSITFDDSGSRMISAGGQTVKVWTKTGPAMEATLNMNGKRDLDSEAEQDEVDSEDAENSDDEQPPNAMQDSDDDSDERPAHKRKKRKRAKGKDRSGRELNLAGMF